VRLKLDENVHGDVAAELRQRGHDIRTVHDQGLAGRPDADIASAVQTEGRCLVTFDLDFADPRLHPRGRFSGLVVLRLGVPTFRNQVAALARFFAEDPEVKGRLWIVEESRARDWTP
jgi:predicted nuclease of predicted toxin-antitoxin system